jgi:hypothetical protein
VTITAKDTGAVRALVSNSDGLFEAVNLMPGDYSIEVSAPGFLTLSRNVTLEVNQRMGIDFAMEIGQRQETVAVTATAETLKTQDASLGEVPLGEDCACPCRSGASGQRAGGVCQQVSALGTRRKIFSAIPGSRSQVCSSTVPLQKYSN